MKVQYASDLHLEFEANRAFLRRGGLVPSADVLIVPGDMGFLGDRKMERREVFDWFADHFKETWIVPGNHEYYHGYELQDTLTDFEYAVRPNVRYVNNKAVRIDDAEVFFTTLWSPVPPIYVADVQLGMNDTKYICYKGSVLFAGEYNELHRICLDWLTRTILSDFFVYLHRLLRVLTGIDPNLLQKRPAGDFSQRPLSAQAG